MKKKKLLVMKTMNISEIKQCKVCHGYNLSEGSILLEDSLSETYKMTNVKICLDCDTIHYIRNNDIYYEFNIEINRHIITNIVKEHEHMD